MLNPRTESDESALLMISEEDQKRVSDIANRFVFENQITISEEQLKQICDDSAILYFANEDTVSQSLENTIVARIILEIGITSKNCNQAARFCFSKNKPRHPGFSLASWIQIHIDMWNNWRFQKGTFSFENVENNVKRIPEDVSEYIEMLRLRKRRQADEDEERAELQNKRKCDNTNNPFVRRETTVSDLSKFFSPPDASAAASVKSLQKQ